MSEQTGQTLFALPQPTPHRPVVSLALVLFMPNLWLVMHGNLSVQTALVRFIGALLVSWIAAWLVFATIRSFSRSGSSPEGAGLPGSVGVTSPASTVSPASVALAGRPDGARSTPLP